MNCNRADCQNAATKRPVLTMAAKCSPSGPRAEMQVGLVVCDEHAVDDVDWYITDQGWTMIVDAFVGNGKAEPDRSSVRITYEPLYGA